LSTHTLLDQDFDKKIHEEGLIRKRSSLPILTNCTTWKRRNNGVIFWSGVTFWRWYIQ